MLAAGRTEGMCTLETWLNHLIANGAITYDDALARSAYPKELRPGGAMPATAVATR
jgi:twitching motility protein PilT